MIEKIFIPTVHRVDNQITYNSLPKQLQSKVVMVVQAWERSQYKYDCEYLVLPDTKEYHYTDYLCLAKTRRLIYEHGKNIKYSVLDDDLEFYRRNSKYFGLSSNMEKSKRKCLPEDIIDMFDIFDKLLDNDDITVVGCKNINLPPTSNRYEKNCSVTCGYWINGSHFASDLDSFDLTSIRTGEDVCFILHLLMRGFGNRLSNEFCLDNQSYNNKQMKSTVWDTQTVEASLKDQIYLQKLFNQVISFPSDAEGSGYRGHGKLVIKFKKAYELGIARKQNKQAFDNLFDLA